METKIRELSMAIVTTDLHILIEEIKDLKMNLSVELQAVRDDRRAQQREFREHMNELREALDQIRAQFRVEGQLLNLIRGPSNAGDKKQKENQRGRGRTEAQVGRISSIRQ